MNFFKIQAIFKMKARSKLKNKGKKFHNHEVQIAINIIVIART